MEKRHLKKEIDWKEIDVVSSENLIILIESFLIVTIPHQKFGKKKKWGGLDMATEP